MMVNISIMLATCALMALALGGVAGFPCPPLGAKTSSGAAKTRLMMSSTSQSRRDIFSNAAASIAGVGLSSLVIGPNDDAMAFQTGSVTAQSAANKAAESYQGVYSDPRHPGGYRILMASGKGGATMTLSDGVAKDAPEGTEEKTYKNIPVDMKEGSNEFVFDFSFKGGPKQLVGMLSDDKKTITFSDGNVWTKNANKYDGIYKDPKYPDGYRIIRKLKSTITITEVNDTGNPKDSRFIVGKHASLFSIPTAAFTFYDYTGKEVCSEKLCRTCEVVCKDEIVGQFSLEEANTVFPYGTITFPDKTVWTRI